MTDPITIERQEPGGESPLVAVGDIARLAGVQLDTARQWQRRPSTRFPAPVARTSAGAVYLRSEVEEWLRETGRLRQ